MNTKKLKELVDAKDKTPEKLGESSSYSGMDVRKAIAVGIAGAALLVASGLSASPSTNLENPTTEQPHIIEQPDRQPMP